MTTTSGQGQTHKARRILKRVVYSVLGLSIVAAIVIAWMPRPVAVEIATVTRGPLRVTVDEDGQARVKDRYIVSAPLAGRLGRIELEPGDTVRRGAIVARIAPAAPALLDERVQTTANARLQQTLAAQRQAKIQVADAQARFDHAVVEEARQRQLLDHGAGTRQAAEQAELSRERATHERDATRFATQVADYEVEMARAALDRMPGARSGGTPLDVPAPIGGRVLKVVHKSEGVVQPGAQLLEIGDADALEVVIDVLTSDAARIQPGAKVTVDGWGGPTLNGRVRRIEPSAFTRLSALGVEEQRVNLLVDLTSPRTDWTALGDGYRVEAHIVVWEAPDVLKVRTNALFRHEEGWAVFRIDGRVARLTKVDLGQRTATEAQITRGLDAGQRVVAHPSDRISDGIKVKGP